MFTLTFKRSATFLTATLASIACRQFAWADSTSNSGSTEGRNLWAHDNLYAWEVDSYLDAKMRGPEERAQMLERLGFKHYAHYYGSEKDFRTFDTEIEALQKHGIDLLGWWFPFDADNPKAKAILEIFKRHNVHPQLWVPQSLSDMLKTQEELAKLLPKRFAIPMGHQGFEKLSEADQEAFQKVWAQLNAKDLPKTPAEQEQRVKREADRINALVKLAAPYGNGVELYNHNGWFGMEENQLAIIDRLKEIGVTGVGMVYNFCHARDELHDDSKNFQELWGKMKEHVIAVNITGMRSEWREAYPAQGDGELNMMRTIQDSGWTGPVGLVAVKIGDAKVTLGNDITGLDWLAAELRQPGSGGPLPFPLLR